MTELMNNWKWKKKVVLSQSNGEHSFIYLHEMFAVEWI